MAEFDLSSFDTFDVQKRRAELSNQPVSEELLKARAQTERMINQYNGMNMILGAMGKRTSAPMAMPTYDDNSAAVNKQAGLQVKNELLQALVKLQEQIGRPLTMDEVPSVIKAFNIGGDQLSMLNDVYPFLGLTRDQQEKAKQQQSEDRVAAAYGEVMSNHRDLIFSAGPETVAYRVEEALSDINSRDDLSPEEKQEASDQLFEDFKSLIDLNRTNRNELRTIKSNQDEALAKAMETGQNFTVNELIGKAIERINNGEPYEQVYRDITKSANTVLRDREILASLDTRLKSLKPEDKRTAALQSFEEKQGMITDGGIRGIEEAIQMEIESRSQNPLLYNFTGPMNEAMAIENIFYNLKITKPEAINEDAFRAEFSLFKEAIKNLDPQQQKVEIMKAMGYASEKLQLPVRLLLYVVYGKKGYEKLIKEGRI